MTLYVGLKTKYNQLPQAPGYCLSANGLIHKTMTNIRPRVNSRRTYEYRYIPT